MASLDPKQTLLVMALAEESQGLFENAGLQPLYTGLGSINSTYSLTRAIYDLKPKAILNLGTAGSFRLLQGKVVECSAFVQRHLVKKSFASKKIITSHYLTELPKAVCGTADHIEQSQDPQNQNFYEIMDMEGYALAYVAQQSKIPFHAVKFISDNSGQDVFTNWKGNLPAAAKNLFQVYQEITEKF